MNTILVPLDFSDVTPRVVEVAAKMAQASTGSLVLLHVHPPEPPMVSYEAVSAETPFNPDIDVEPERKQLRDWMAVLSDRGIEVQALHMQGPPTDQILAAAEANGASMIVMGSHGHGAVFDLLVGNVTHGVLHGAKCPVTVVPARGA